MLAIARAVYCREGGHGTLSHHAGVAKLVIRARLKIGCPSGRLGSTPSPGME